MAQDENKIPTNFAILKGLKFEKDTDDHLKHYSAKVYDIGKSDWTDKHAFTVDPQGNNPIVKKLKEISDSHCYCLVWIRLVNGAWRINMAEQIPVAKGIDKLLYGLKEKK